LTSVVYRIRTSGSFYISHKRGERGVGLILRRWSTESGRQVDKCMTQRVAINMALARINEESVPLTSVVLGIRSQVVFFMYDNSKDREESDPFFVDSLQNQEVRNFFMSMTAARRAKFMANLTSVVSRIRTLQMQLIAIRAMKKVLPEP
jgi:hypothetical protein